MLISLQSWLIARLAAQAESQPDLEVILNELVSKWCPIRIIDELLGDPDDLIAVSSRSYRHDNGFDRIEIVSSVDPEYALRLHVWWGSETSVKERIHGHPWEFASMVIAGELQFEQFIEAPSGKPVSVFYYSRPVAKGVYTLTPAGEAHLKPILRASMPRGTRYGARREMLHRVWTEPGRDTVTLMLHGKGEAYPSRVFGSRDQDHATLLGEHHLRPRLACDHLEANLRRIRGLLGAAN